MKALSPDTILGEGITADKSDVVRVHEWMEWAAEQAADREIIKHTPLPFFWNRY